jgi:hypothetical protein
VDSQVSASRRGAARSTILCADSQFHIDILCRSELFKAMSAMQRHRFTPCSLPGEGSPVLYCRDSEFWLDCETIDSTDSENPVVLQAIARNNSPAAVFGNIGRVLLAVLAVIVIIYGSLGLFHIH